MFLDGKSFLILAAAVINVGLAFFILNQSPKRWINRVYWIFTLMVVGWEISMVFCRSLLPSQYLLDWYRALYFFPVVFTGIFLYFVFIFPDGSLRCPRWAVALIGGWAMALIYLIVFTPHIVKQVIWRPGQNEVELGRLYWMYMSYIIGLFGWSYYILIDKIRRYKGVLRAQLSYIFWGAFLASSIGMISNLILPAMHIFVLQWLGQVTTVILAAFVAYAIVKLRLLDIKLAIKISTINGVSVILILLYIVLLRYVILIGLPNWQHFFLLEDALVVVSAFVLFYPIRRYFSFLANKYFFSSIYDERKVITKLSDLLRSTLELKKILQYIADTIIHTFHSHSVLILLYNRQRGKYELAYKYGFKGGEEQIKPLLSDFRLHRLFVLGGGAINKEEMKSLPEYSIDKETIRTMEDNGIEMIVPLGLRNRNIGLIVLGMKESGDDYTQRDIGVLEIISAQAAVVIANALMYEEAKRFSIKLEREIKKATRDLRLANQELMKLDEVKSEFISIASHQLRTPLTVIKGYISMILEGNFGKITEELKNPLNKVYRSNEQLIKLVEDLLSVSRIESGRMVYSFEVQNLEPIVEGVVEDLRHNAKERGVTIIYHRPLKLLPKAKIDRDKMKQVIMNFLDNAIKYTQRATNRKGRVEVSYFVHDNKLGLCVRDNGIGIRPEDLPHLFEKFTRGKGISVVNTQGTGLGLYVAKQIVLAHNGKVWAESKGEGKGAKFCLELPIASNQ